MTTVIIVVYVTIRR